MIRPLRAAWRLMLIAALSATLSPLSAAADTAPREGILSQGIRLATAEANAMRARGQRVWCVPFARTASGVNIRGNAKTWWASAAGLYDRGHEPAIGAVMVFSGSKKMPMGHVAVVSGVIDERTILIDHANWKRNKVSLGMAVVDVSDAGDWSAVRVEGDPGVVGRVNPVSGFIYPETAEIPKPKAAKSRKARRPVEERIASR
jgi:hypothetical protein